MLASVNVKFWPLRAPGCLDCMCHPRIMEGAIKDLTSPRVYHSDERTGTNFTGQTKRFWQCSNFRFQREVLSCTGRSTSQEYPNRLGYGAK
jgi:hypothetical protein